MKHQIQIFLIMLVAACSLGFSTSAQKENSVLLSVDGRVAHPLSLTRADLDKLPRHSVTTKSRDGKDHSYEGIAVSDLLLKAGVEFGEALHQEAAATYLLAEATDGYRVVFALPEFDSVSNDRLIIIADRQDGNPLAKASGPLQLIAPGDKGHGRWVRQIKSITLVVAPKTGAVARP